MPVYKKPSHGKIHLYGGKGKHQPYIGPLDDPKKWDTKVARETLVQDDKSFNQYFQKYIDNVLLLSLYLPQQDRNEYLSKRTTELVGMLWRLEEEIPEENWKLIEDVLGTAMKKADKHTVEKIARDLQKKYGQHARS